MAEKVIIFYFKNKITDYEAKSTEKQRALSHTLYHLKKYITLV